VKSNSILHGISVRTNDNHAVFVYLFGAIVFSSCFWDGVGLFLPFVLEALAWVLLCVHFGSLGFTGFQFQILFLSFFSFTGELGWWMGSLRKQRKSSAISICLLIDQYGDKIRWSSFRVFFFPWRVKWEAGQWVWWRQQYHVSLLCMDIFSIAGFCTMDGCVMRRGTTYTHPNPHLHRFLWRRICVNTVSCIFAFVFGGKEVACLLASYFNR